MTNIHDDDIDLGLALGCAAHNIQTRRTDDSGAGVNASSRVDMTFAASDPLSELVWSPHKGLSLKCADSGLADKKPLLLWNVGPSNVIASPSQSKRSKGTSDDNAIHEKIIVSRGRFLLDAHSLARSSDNYEANIIGSRSGNEMGQSGEVKIMSTADGVDIIDTNENEEKLRSSEKGSCTPQNIQDTQMAESCENLAGQLDFGTQRPLLHGASNSKLDMETEELLEGNINQETSTNAERGNEDIMDSSQILSLGITMALIPTVKDSETPACLLPNSLTKQETDVTMKLAVEENSGNKENAFCTASLPVLEKLECTAENDIHLQGTKGTCGQNEQQLLLNSTVPLETSTQRRTSSYRRKGKGKALSKGNSDIKMSDDEEDSHGSAESCNSAGLIPKGKKRWHFEQQIFVGSKRIRKHMHGDHASVSTVAHDSSFMTWISNMVKGFSKSNLEKPPTLELKFDANRDNEENHGKESSHREIIMYDKDHDSSRRYMGFHNVFQSLYCPTSKLSQMEIPKEDHSLGDTNDKVLIEVPPISCRQGDKESYAQILMSNEKVNQSTVAYKEVLRRRSQIMPPVVAPQEASRSTSAENKASSDVACSKAKDAVSSSDSMYRFKTSTGEDDIAYHPSECNAVYNLSTRSFSLSSLWITRFSIRTPITVSNIDNCKIDTHETLACSTDCSRPNPLTQTSDERLVGEKSLEARETSIGDQSGGVAANFDASASSKDIYGNNSERSINNLHPIIPSAKFKKSEAMASLFARRLDALKHIVPSSTRNEYTCTKKTCFFCGRSGHDLRNCSEVTESELEILIRNIRSYDGAEESPCLCIRCFQLDHWAISCPTSSAIRSQRLEHNMSLVNQNRTKNWQLFTGNGCLSSHLETKNCHSTVPANQALYKKGTLCSFADHSDLMHNRNELFVGRVSGSNEVQKQIRKGMFDIIRGLRLSRLDILRWMNSNATLSHLDGLFLRLRLGKCEAGIGGTEYYVARITGLQRENAESDSKQCISVNVGGFKCLVGSQHVSNHDFLEDELTAWWCKTLESGGNVPSEEDLKQLLQDRMKLGF